MLMNSHIGISEIQKFLKMPIFFVLNVSKQTFFIFFGKTMLPICFQKRTFIKVLTKKREI